jgi:hypothetical protein
MSSAYPYAPRSLPPSPNLRHLKDQARDLLRAGEATSLANAQFKIARSYGFASWPKLKAHVELLEEAGQLKHAIDTNDLAAVRRLMSRNPSLHRAPLGYRDGGPLTWAAECRGLVGGAFAARLEIVDWMIRHGSDVHQGGDGPLMRAALRDERIPMMKLLVAHGADVNARWNGWFPILFAPCESVDPGVISWLLQHGADPNLRGARSGETPLDYLLEGYGRSGEIGRCIDTLMAAGGQTRNDAPGVLEVIRDQPDALGTLLDARPKLIRQPLPPLLLGNTGGRRLVAGGATLLHLAAEFGCAEVATLLIARGADVNARAVVDEQGVGGQTPLFHAVAQYNDAGLAVARVLLDAGADLSVRARIPGGYEDKDEIVECTPLEYAERFPGDEFPGSNSGTLELLRSRAQP